MNPRNFSIRGKLYMLSGSAAAMALLLASVAFSYQHISTFRENTVSQLRSVGEVLAANTIAAITFDDQVAASEVLASLKRSEDVTAACIISNDGNVFASYVRDGMVDETAFPDSRTPGYEFGSTGALEMYIAISDGDEQHGTLYLRSSMDELQRSLRQYAVMVTAVFCVALLAALLLSSRLQSVIATPIKQLAGTAETISETRDYSIRVRRHANDEIGTLFDAFNDMLEQIETSEKKLIETRNELEIRVEQRTSQLTESHSQLTLEMEEKQKIQRRLIDASRQAGMAEVATGVLHNVGNVLNSVNVSANLVLQQVRESRISSLIRLNELVNENVDDLPAFVSSERGRLVPRMLDQLSGCLQDERRRIAEEVKSLQTNIDHIKKIVSAQQSFGSMFGVIESVDLSEVLNESIDIGGSLDNHNIVIERDFGEISNFSCDRHQLMQILVNLIRNAGQAIKSTKQNGGKIVLRSSLGSDKFVSLQVVDDGIGMNSETLKKVFTHGFTTKKEGHGFGLHSAALAAKEMGGSLSVQSDGLNQGSTFTLRLPIQFISADAESAPAI